MALGLIRGTIRGTCFKFTTMYNDKSFYHLPLIKHPGDRKRRDKP